MKKRTYTLNPWAVLRLLCWIAGHRWEHWVGFHAMDGSGRKCRRCLRNEVRAFEPREVDGAWMMHPIGWKRK